MNAKTWTAAVLFAAFAVTPGSAATLTVDRNGSTPYQTIQAAINAAVPGVDSVFVRCGTYLENVVIKDQVSVVGQSPACAIIDGRALGTTVHMLQIGAGTQLRGFTIRNGRAAFGGGIYLESSSATITGNVITGNSAVFTAGDGGAGGGIYITSGISAQFLATTPVISRNIIRGNHAERFGGGIEIEGDDGSTISGNLIAENVADEAGGGIDAYQAFPSIVNNTIAHNCPQGAETPCALGGGGISLDTSGVVNIVNNLIFSNGAANGGAGVDMTGSTATFTSNDTFGNQPVDYAGVANPTGSNGNLSVNPLLVDEQSGFFFGYQPRSDSPLIDAGAAPLAPPLDLRGVPRPVDGNVDGNALPDIGARENEGITRLLFTSKTALSWDLSVATSPSYNLYRGDLQTLRTTGLYMQDPATVVGAARQCGLGSPAASDLASPATGKTFFYLATVKRTTVEGTLGFSSAAVERPSVPANRCP